MYVVELDYPNKIEKKILDNYAKKEKSALYPIKKYSYFHPKFNSIKFDMLRSYKMYKCFGVKNYFNNFQGLVKFIIAGFAKTGSTSLHNYLEQHENISGPWTKELHFFNFGYKKGIKYYNSNFRFSNNKKILNFESSIDYILDSTAIKRIKKYNPEMKLVICLRNPIDQVYSNYNHMRVSGDEIQSFEDAIKNDVERKELHLNRLENGIYNNVIHPIIVPYLYFAQYSTHIKKALEVIDIENVFFVDSEELKVKTQSVVDDVFTFLGLEKKQLKIKFLNSHKYEEPMDCDMRNKLKAYFTPFNDELEKMLNRKFNWE